MRLAHLLQPILDRELELLQPLHAARIRRKARLLAADLMIQPAVNKGQAVVVSVCDDSYVGRLTTNEMAGS